MRRSALATTTGLAIAATTLPVALDATTRADEPPPPPVVEWIIVPDPLGQGQWLVDSEGNEYRMDDGWIEIDADGVTLTVPWPWVHWRPLAGGRVSLVVGHG
jgi:hypothetical protein